ncbi:MFS transporter [Corynebacterium ammoniagenes]|uniref:MFS transporter n=2 Tax=Corynebacterium ammoniagenes TaxID=1697 RepID=A0AAV5G7L6_CORAM|nr:MFS transporter [Corynebacterium ammoniagenes]APT83106.1 major facilitator transporter [Corynebacterium ammoniagenes DSM 20306]AQS74133.1 MFS transporter [Corynebacterium ammoniagenes]EFG82048.1 transporter, major facilitator family protein [Corynebacterium ammoniagenes DSM 20306]NMF31259.1 MFS transporter [Corynebacterium ammoniagenes]GJN42619.1 MFS transporter [Corynebacterium ammoniagenes]
MTQVSHPVNPSSSANDAEPWNREISKKTVYYVSFVCFLAWVASVYDYTLFGTLLPVIAEDFGWSTAQATAVNTWAMVGVLIVCLAVGTIIDRMGRKRALILLVIGGAISSGLTGAAIGALSMIIIRSFSGFAVSEEVVNSVYLNEIYRKTKSRGFMFSLVQSGWPVGALFGAAMTALLLPTIGWRWSFVLAAAVSIIVLVLATRLPESPTFLAMKEVQRRIDSGNLEGARALALEQDIEMPGAKSVGFKGVFTPELRRHTISLCLAWLFSWMAIQVFSVLGTTVLVEAKNYEFTDSLTVLILGNVAAFIGYLFHGWLGDRIGRRPAVFGGWLLGGLASLGLLLGPETSAYVIAMYSASLFFLNGPFAAMLFYMGESYPAHVRGVGANLAHVMAPAGAILGSGLISVLLGTGLSMTAAAVVAGSVPLLLAALMMLGTRKVAVDTSAE